MKEGYLLRKYKFLVIGKKLWVFFFWSLRVSGALIRVRGVVVELKRFRKRLKWYLEEGMELCSEEELRGGSKRGEGRRY